MTKSKKSKSVTEQEEETARKIIDILGDSQITYFEYSFDEDDDEKTRVIWYTMDNDSKFRHYLEFGWLDDN